MDRPAVFRWDANVSDDGQTVVVRHLQGDNVVSALTFDAQELDALISGLGQVRSQMADQVPDQLEPNSRLQAIASPSWRIPGNLGPDGSRLVALRHPGFGWLGFLIAPETGDEMARWLGSHRPDTPQP